MAGYKIKDLETLTGIKAHTIRMWEKRYGLLSPDRTDTKIRLYDNSDLEKLLNVAILYENGVKISKIAELSQEETKSKITELYEQNHSCGMDAHLLLQSTISLKCHDFDRVLTDIIKVKGLEQAYRNCLSPFIKSIESLLKVGKITTVQKNFVYNLIRQKIISETNYLPIRDEHGFDAILFTPEGQSQEFCLLFYNFMLQKHNYKTLYLGVNLPTEELKKAIEETNPKRIVITMTDDHGQENYSKTITTLAEKTGLPVYVGGFLSKKHQIPENVNAFSIKDLFGKDSD